VRAARSAVPSSRATGVIVRLANAQDVESLSALCGEHAAFERLPFEPAGHPARLRALLGVDSPPLYAWIALVKGNAVGYAAASPAVSTIDGTTYLHLDCLYVCAGHRNRRIGRQLMTHAIGLGTTLGYPRMEWQTPVWNRAAAQFYRRHGASARRKLRFALPLA
jgi:GNAT superfamily N-acetyltransferase